MAATENVPTERDTAEHNTTNVPYKLLNDGNKIPMIGLGTYEQKFYRKVNSAQLLARPIRGAITKLLNINPMTTIRKTIRWAVEAGYRHIDTADVYWNEVQVGLGIADVLADGLVKREDLYIIAKLPFYKHEPDQVVPALKDSLAKLRVSYADLFLIHTPIPVSMDSKFRLKHVDVLDTWKGMEEAHELGLARSLGVSNFSTDQITRLVDNCRVTPTVNQIEVNPTHIRKSLVSHCHQLGVAVMAHTPFGFMVERQKYNMPSAPPPRHDDPVLLRIAERYKKTPAQVVLRYLLDRDIIPIPKATNKLHLGQNIDVFDFKLTPDEIETINGFNRDFGVYMWQ